MYPRLYISGATPAGLVTASLTASHFIHVLAHAYTSISGTQTRYGDLIFRLPL